MQSTIQETCFRISAVLCMMEVLMHWPFIKVCRQNCKWTLPLLCFPSSPTSTSFWERKLWERFSCSLMMGQLICRFYKSLYVCMQYIIPIIKLRNYDKVFFKIMTSICISDVEKNVHIPELEIIYPSAVYDKTKYWTVPYLSYYRFSSRWERKI